MSPAEHRSKATQTALLTLGIFAAGCGARSAGSDSPLRHLLSESARTPIALEQADAFTQTEQQIVKDAVLLAHLILSQSPEGPDQAKARSLLTMRIRCEPGERDALGTIDAAWFPQEKLTRVYRSGVQDPLRLTLAIMHESHHALFHSPIAPGASRLEAALYRSTIERETHLIDLTNADRLAQHVSASAERIHSGLSATLLSEQLANIRRLQTSDRLLADYHGALVSIFKAGQLLLAAHDTPAVNDVTTDRAAENQIMTSYTQLLRVTALDPPSFLRAGAETTITAKRMTEVIPHVARYRESSAAVLAHLRDVEVSLERMRQTAQSLRAK